MIVINYFLLQLYRGIGLSVEEVVYDPCKKQFLMENELFESGGEITSRIELYNSLINPIKESINTLVNCIKSIYKANNLIFKEEEEKIVSESLGYELSDILIHYIYTDDDETYKSSIDKINEYMPFLHKLSEEEIEMAHKEEPFFNMRRLSDEEFERLMRGK